MTAYDQSQAFGGVIDVLEAIGAKYAIGGGMAVVAYGEPRFTQDMDILNPSTANLSPAPRRQNGGRWPQRLLDRLSLLLPLSQ